MAAPHPPGLRDPAHTGVVTRPSALARSRLAPLRGLSRRSHDGNPILQHRSMWRLALPGQRLASGLVLALAFTALLGLLRPWVGAAWGQVLAGWLGALGWPGAAAAVPAWPQDLGAVALDAQLLQLPVPELVLPLAAPGWPPLLGQGLVALLLWLLSTRLPDAARPGQYLLRAVALVLGASALFFATLPQAFPHTAGAHLSSGLQQGWVLMLLLPWLHLATYYLFPFSHLQRAGLTALSLLWLVALVPMLYAGHGALLLAFGLPVLPLLQLLVGLVLPILGLVALYGWGMSWPHSAPPRRRDVDASRRPEPALAQRP